MAKAIIIPRLGLTMEKATIMTWMKQEGDRVEKGEPICIIETDKINFEIEAPESGILVKIMAQEGDILPVGEVIAVVAEGGETFDLDTVIKKAKELKAPPEERPAEIPITISSPRLKEGRREVKASPLARRIAEEKGVSLEGIIGTGPGGSITKEDVLRTIKEGEERPLQISKRIPLKGIRRLIAERMTLSWHTAPRVTQVMEVDMTEVVRFREENQSIWESKGVRASLNDILIKVVSQALMEVPEINSSLKGDEIEVYGNVNIGIAIATDRGLIVPVLRNTHKKSLLEIAQESSGLIQRTQEGKIGPDDLKFGTFTITNLGIYGVDLFTPIINQPESAILGVGKLDRKVKVVEEDKIAIRSTMNFCLTFDHRVIDGAPAARFLGRLKEILEDPSQLKGLI
ncbi:MAG: dihydrolipoamide acetyltransferase family protein [Thermodesulfobacteriota bacterium]|nr:dihydrolipoamide acetyltransferase family protein [Thermodesulfobacteriota bacterium]